MSDLGYFYGSEFGAKRKKLPLSPIFREGEDKQ